MINLLTAMPITGMSSLTHSLGNLRMIAQNALLLWQTQNLPSNNSLREEISKKEAERVERNRVKEVNPRVKEERVARRAKVRKERKTLLRMASQL